MTLVELKTGNDASQTVLELADISCVYGRLELFRDLHLRVEAGEVLVIEGEHGKGKTTLLQVAAGTLEPSEGLVTWGGQVDDPMVPSRLFRNGVRRGVLSAGGDLINNLSALDNVLLPLRYHHECLSALGILSDAVDGDMEARTMLSRVGVERIDWHELPAHLSLSTRKRIAIARMLAYRPNYLFLDDMEAGLSVDLLDEVIPLFVERVAAGAVMVTAGASEHLLAAMQGPSVIKRFRIGQPWVF
jgi:ABC-type transporter Mla maintaining outer membrane lipid asymmetry ATPase subunit MlaF